MIAASRAAKLGAVATAVFVHGALAMVVVQPSEIKIAGGAGGGGEARLGTSFADMAVGTLDAQTADDIAELLEAEAVDAPSEVETASETESAEQVSPDITMPPPEQSIAELTPLPSLTPPPSLTAPIEAITPDIPALEQATEAPLPAEILHAPTQEMLEAEPPAAVSESLRPKQRSDDFEEAHEKAQPKPKSAAKARSAPKEQTSPKPKGQPARGNGDQNAVAGIPTGTPDGTANGGGGPSQARGNAAVSNYPGLVMRKITNVPRPRVGSRGTAIIGFSVSGSGGLGNVYLAGSSGSPELDQAALHLVRTAAPFPAPPPGAQRSFTISIKGR